MCAKNKRGTHSNKKKHNDSVMATMTINQQITPFTINIPKVDIKRFKGLAKVMGWTFEEVETDYYESAQFYKDIDKAEEAIAKGEGKTINNLDELNALFL